MSQLDDFLKMLDEEDYTRALKKEQTKQRVKKATAVPKKEKLPTVKTGQQKLAEKVKMMETQDKYDVLQGKGKPESGKDAVDRLLKAVKDQDNLMFNKSDGSPTFSGQSEISPRGVKGSNFRIAQERMDEIQTDLKTAQKAKKRGTTFQEAKKHKKADDKYRELLKMFKAPGVDKRKADYLARMTTNKFFRK
jgi:hypothetical protein